MDMEIRLDEAPHTPETSMEALLGDETDQIDYFNVYLEFISFWIKTDAASYQNASTMTNKYEEKELLLSMVHKKSHMLDTFASFCKKGKNAGFETEFENHSSVADFLIENNFKLFQGLQDVFHYAYRREYHSLNTFKKVNPPNLDSAIQSLLELAIAFQHQHILYLDSRLNKFPHESKSVSIEATKRETEKQWALISVSG